MRYRIIPNFLTPSECDKVIALAKERLTPSTVWNLKGGFSEHADTVRKSEMMFFQPQENPVIKKIENKITRTTGYPVDHGEPIQVVKYTTGGFYKAHHDFFDVEQDGSNRDVVEKRGGQRVATVLMYLNTLEPGQGGETYFSQIDLKVRPERGKAIVWLNVLPEDPPRPDPTTLHSAEPLLYGEKAIATKWIRFSTFR